MLHVAAQSFHLPLELISPKSSFDPASLGSPVFQLVYRLRTTEPVDTPVQDPMEKSLPDHSQVPSVAASLKPIHASPLLMVLAAVVFSLALMMEARKPVRPPSVMPEAVDVAADGLLAPLVMSV